MIKANELRIGNWVVNDCDDRMIQVDAADILTASKDEDWLLPIPLTPEILEKAGFEHFSHSLTNIRYTSRGFCDECIYNANNGQFVCFLGVHSVFVKYLHQLQNLYFPLMGEELKIELNERSIPSKDNSKKVSFDGGKTWVAPTPGDIEQQPNSATLD